MARIKKNRQNPAPFTDEGGFQMDDLLSGENSVMNNDTASKLLANVFDAVGTEQSSVPLDKLSTFSQYRSEKYTVQKTVTVIVLLILLLLPLCFITPRFTVTEAETGATGRRFYDVTVHGFMPVRRVSATVDGGISFPVFETGDRSYTIEPTSNGEMEVTVRLLNRQYSVQTVTVEKLDYNKPRLVSQEVRDGMLCLSVSDGDDGLGVAWDEVRYETNDGITVLPDEIDEETGCAAFSFPEESVNFFFPDKNGNTLQMLFTPNISDRAGSKKQDGAEEDGTVPAESSEADSDDGINDGRETGKD